jgi:cytochrome P450
VGRFFYLPNSLFLFLEKAIATLGPDSHAERSMEKVDSYVAGLVEGSEKKDNYPGRLLRAGFSPSETRAQCKDLIFAGTDSTGMNLASICWYLVRNPCM